MHTMLFYFVVILNTTYFNFYFLCLLQIRQLALIAKNYTVFLKYNQNTFE